MFPIADDKDKKDEKKDEGEGRDFEVEGTVAGEATVTEITSKQEEPKQDVTLLVGSEHITLDADDPDVQRLVSRGAGRETAKAAAASAQPRAFTQAGRVD